MDGKKDFLIESFSWETKYRLETFVGENYYVVIGVNEFQNRDKSIILFFNIPAIGIAMKGSETLVFFIELSSTEGRLSIGTLTKEVEFLFFRNEYLNIDENQ